MDYYQRQAPAWLSGPFGVQAAAATPSSECDSAIPLVEQLIDAASRFCEKQEEAALMSPAEGISAELRLKIEPAEQKAKEQRGSSTVCGAAFLLLVCLYTCARLFWHKY